MSLMTWESVMIGCIFVSSAVTLCATSGKLEKLTENKFAVSFASSFISILLSVLIALMLLPVKDEILKKHYIKEIDSQSPIQWIGELEGWQIVGKHLSEGVIEPNGVQNMFYYFNLKRIRAPHIYIRSVPVIKEIYEDENNKIGKSILYDLNDPNKVSANWKVGTFFDILK